LRNVNIHAPRDAQDFTKLDRPRHFVGAVRLLIISFVIWGVGDMFRGFVLTRSRGRGQSITTQQYQSSLQTVMFRIQSRTHRNLTSAQAHELGLDRQVLET